MAAPISNGVTNGVSHGHGFKYAAFKLRGDGSTPRIGSLDIESGQVTPLSYRSGTYIHTLYEVIETAKDNIIESGEPIPISQIELLPPLYGKDIMAVGKNYAEHAKEFNASGYDSSDKVDQPTHPVIFTKRATSIVAHGAEISPHPKFTQSLDYEGEIGVIIGKKGFQVPEAEAPEYVWGYTIINDVTAREKQRDHKQFFLGKSADTFCPMGPIAMAKEDLPAVLEVVTRVNGEQRQRATTNDLIFSVPRLISVISKGQTILPGDVIATGTPAGVGFGFQPPKWLRPGDEVEVSVTALGTLKNKVGGFGSANHLLPFSTNIPIIYNNKALGVSSDNVDQGRLISVRGKDLFYKTAGTPSGKPTLFIHGLGGTHDYFNGLVERLQSKRSMHLFDLEGHGLSPVHASQTLSLSSFAADAQAIAQSAGLPQSGVTVIAHSMGCLVALELAVENPGLVDEIVLMGPPPSPLPAAGATATYARAATVRSQGMNAVAETVARGGTSVHTQSHNPLAFIAARLCLLGQDPEGYAKACHALADSTHDTIDVSKIQGKTLLLTGSDDKVSPPTLCQKYNSQIAASEIVVLDNVAHWHLFEDHVRTIDAVDGFLA